MLQSIDFACDAVAWMCVAHIRCQILLSVAVGLGAGRGGPGRHNGTRRGRWFKPASPATERELVMPAPLAAVSTDKKGARVLLHNGGMFEQDCRDFLLALAEGGHRRSLA